MTRIGKSAILTSHKRNQSLMRKGRVPIEKKLRYSHQREMICQYLLASTEHPSADMIYEALRSEVQGISLATVYRNLKLLEELGKVRRVASYQNTERYDAHCGDHAHFVCSRCGCVRDLMSADTDAIRSALKLEKGYQSTKLDLTITGLCPDCAAQ